MYICCYLQIANPDIVDCAKDADILVFVIPHQFVKGICKSIKGKLKPGAFAISLIKVSITSSIYRCV